MILGQLTSMVSLIYWKYISDNGDSRPDSINSNQGCVKGV